MANWDYIDHQHSTQQDARIDRAAARQAARDAAFANISASAKIYDLTLTRELTTGNIYRECDHCGAYAEFTGLDSLDLTPCRCQTSTVAASVPFCGELNAKDAIDTVPGCYGL